MALSEVDDLSPGAILALAGAALLVVGALLPWSATAAERFSGLVHGDGYVTFAVGVAVLVLVVGLEWGRVARAAAGLAGLLGLGLFAKWYTAIGAEAVSEPRVGLYLTALAGALLVGGALWAHLDAYVRGDGPTVGRTDAAEEDAPGRQRGE